MIHRAEIAIPFVDHIERKINIYTFKEIIYERSRNDRVVKVPVLSVKPKWSGGFYPPRFEPWLRQNYLNIFFILVSWFEL